MSVRREHDMFFRLRGSLGSDFVQSFRNASSEMRSLQSAMGNLNSRMRDISAYQRQLRAIEQQNGRIQQNEQRLEELQERHRELREAMESTTNPSEQLRHQLEQNERQIQSVNSSIVSQNDELRNMQRELDDARTALQQAGVDTDNLSQSTEELQQRYERLSNTRSFLGNISEELETNNAKLKQAVGEFAALAGGIAAGVGATYAATSKQAIDFESAFAGVKKTVDGTPEQLAEIRSGILELSQTDIIAPANEISAVAEAAGQLGIQTENILKFSKTMIDLGESTNLSSEEAASDLAKFANVTKMSQNNFDRLGSTIVALGNNFATTESDIVAMGTRLASTGELTGLSEAQIMGVATALSSLGIEAEAGGSAMSKFLKQFAVADATGNMKKYADVAGMSVEKFSELYKKDSLAAISAFTKGLNDTERNGKSAIQILDEMEIKEVRLSNAVLSLASSDDILTKASALASQAWDENIALSNEAEQRYSTTESRIEKAKNAVQNLGIQIGDMTLPLVGKLADNFGELAQKAQRWVSENGETIKGFASVAVEVAKYALLLKGTQVAYLGLKSGGLLAVKGITKVKAAFQAAGAAAKGAKLSTFASSLTGITTSAAGFVTVGAATVAVLAAIAAAVWLDNKAMQAARKEFADGELFGNGLPKLKDYTEALKENTSETLKFAEEVNGTADELADIQYEMSKARAEVELYGTSLRERGILTSEEAAKMIDPFNSLVSSLEQDFSVRYTAVFDAFKLAASEVATNLGADVAEISSILDGFKSKYTDSLDESQQVVNEMLNRRAAGGVLSSEELTQLQDEMAYISELSDQKSEALYNFEQTQQVLSGMDLGSNQENAISNLKALNEYAQQYLSEVDEAQNTLNRYYDDLREKADTQLQYNKITQGEYDDYIQSLDLAQGITYESYKQKRDTFTSNLQQIASEVTSQIDEAVIKSVNENGISFWDSYIGTLSAYGNFFTGKGFTGQQEDARSNAINATRDIYKDIINEANALSNAAQISPVNIPVQVVAAVEGSKATASVVQSETMPAYAGGTTYSANTFIAGENGPEIITNAPARTVYTAQETQDIFEGYKVFSAILPQAFAAMSSVRAPSVSGGYYSSGDIRIEINSNPVINAADSADMDEKMERYNADLEERLERILDRRAEDMRRNAYY